MTDHPSPADEPHLPAPVENDDADDELDDSLDLSGLGAGFAGLGGLDLGSLLGQAQELMEAQAAAAEQLHTGRAGGGAVTVTVTGGFDFRSVSIDPSVVDPADASMLEDLVLAALRDATSSVERSSKQALGGFGGLLGG